MRCGGLLCGLLERLASEIEAWPGKGLAEAMRVPRPLTELCVVSDTRRRPGGALRGPEEPKRTNRIKNLTNLLNFNRTL